MARVRREIQAVIFDEASMRKKVLILKTIDYSGRRFQWRLLKGGVHEFETEIDGLKREIFEETGLRKINILGKVNTYGFFFKGIKHLVSSYLVKADSTEPIKLQKSEVADSMWTTKKRALRMLRWNDERETLEKLK